FFSSRRRHTRSTRDWSSDVCSSDLAEREGGRRRRGITTHVTRGPDRTTWDEPACQLASSEVEQHPYRSSSTVRRVGSIVRTTGRSEERRVGKESASWWVVEQRCITR